VNTIPDSFHPRPTESHYSHGTPPGQVQIRYGTDSCGLPPPAPGEGSRTSACVGRFTDRKENGHVRDQSRI